MPEHVQAKIAGYGVDIVQLQRIEYLVNKQSAVFNRLLTENELLFIKRKGTMTQKIRAYALFFALKEAVLKACGTGWQEGVAWTDIEIPDTTQCVQVKLGGKLAGIARSKGIHAVIAAAHTEKTIAVSQAFALRS
ncbi:MAG: holo-ACP synthase [Candidatus Auribacterota bacterium]